VVNIGVAYLVDKVQTLTYSYVHTNLLIESGGGKGPVKPQQPVSMTSGANSCRKAKMGGVL